MERGLKSADPHDCTAYTGWTGRVGSHEAGAPWSRLLDQAVADPRDLAIGMVTVDPRQEWHFCMF